MKASSFAILSLSLFLLAAVPAVASEDGDSAPDLVRVEFYLQQGDAKPYDIYQYECPMTCFSTLPKMPWSGYHWELNGEKVVAFQKLDTPIYQSVVKVYAAPDASDPDPTPAFGDNGGSMLYLGLGMVIIIAMLAYIIVVRMDLAKVCRKK